MKKIVFSDIDRTLAIEGVISRKNIDLIDRYIKLGGTFILISGRSVSYTNLIAKQIKGVRYIVCTNGSIIYDLEKEKVGESNAKVQIVKLYEPAKKEAGIKIQEETPEDSAIKAVAMMADAKVF